MNRKSAENIMTQPGALTIAMGLLLGAAVGCAREEETVSKDAPASGAVDTLPTSDSVGDPYTLSAYGYGPVRVGMTVEEARAALGGRLSVPNPAEHACTYVRSEGAPEGVLFMVVEGKVQRVDVGTPAVTTDAGVRVGDTEARAKQLYGDGVTVEPHKYTDGHYLVVAPDSTTRLVFETDAHTVTGMRGGLLPAALWVEGCS